MIINLLEMIFSDLEIFYFFNCSRQLLLLITDTSKKCLLLLVISFSSVYAFAEYAAFNIKCSI